MEITTIEGITITVCPNCFGVLSSASGAEGLQRVIDRHLLFNQHCADRDAAYKDAEDNNCLMHTDTPLEWLENDPRGRLCRCPKCDALAAGAGG